MAGKKAKPAGEPLSADDALAALSDPERPEPERIEAVRRLGALKHLPAIEPLFFVRESAETDLARAIQEALREMDAGAEVVKGLRSPDPGLREAAFRGSAPHSP